MLKPPTSIIHGIYCNVFIYIYSIHRLIYIHCVFHGISSVRKGLSENGVPLNWFLIITPIPIKRAWGHPLLLRQTHFNIYTTYIWTTGKSWQACLSYKKCAASWMWCWDLHPQLPFVRPRIVNTGHVRFKNVYVTLGKSRFHQQKILICVRKKSNNSPTHSNTSS